MKKDKALFIGILFLLLSCLTNAGEIIQIDASSRHLVPNGKAKDAIDGDWIMKNDKVIVIIGNAVAGREANMRAQSVQGAVIDFTSLADNNDYLVAYYPHGVPGPDSRTNPVMFAHKIIAVKSRGREIILRAIHNPTDKAPYEVVTEYVLNDGDDFLRITTTYYNPRTQKIVVDITDNLRMDQDITDASPIGDHKLVFMYNKWFDAAYGLYNASGLFIPRKPKTGSEPGVGLSVLPGRHRIKTDSAGNITLKPKQRVTLARYLLYGKDVATIQGIVSGLEKNKVPLTTFTIADKSNRPVEEVFLEIFNSQKKIVSFGITDQAGKIAVPLAPGVYHYQAAKVGHDTIEGSFSVVDKAGDQHISLANQTSVLFDVKETGTGRRLPYKIEFKGIQGTPDPFLGTSKRAEGADNFFYAINKAATRVPIAPGKYLAIISHGPEYRVIYQTIEIGRGESKSINAELVRLFSSPKWVIADFHNHTTASGDNDSHTKSRIINFAGAGIEFAPATEHNRIITYSDDIKSLGLESFISSAAGVELTGAGKWIGRTPNHQNGFPLKMTEGLQGNGFPGIYPDPFVQLELLYNHDGERFKFIQQNHPPVPYLFFDRNGDGVVDSGFGTRKFTHAIEIQELMYDALTSSSDEATPEQKNNRFFHWLQMLNQGDRIFGTTTSDAHNVGPASGDRFVYAYAQNDDPLHIDPIEIARNAKNGHIIMSNGPFMRVDLNGYLPGDVIQSNGSLTMNIEVFANNEIEIDRVQVLVNGRQDKKLNFTRASYPDLFSPNPRQFSHSFPLELEKDAHIIVVAAGNRLGPAEELSKPLRRRPPVAIANPFFVDVDWNGFSANKDTLGVPLPVMNVGKN